MNAKVLVAYGTTNGSTAKIAETIAETLNKEGLTAEARPAESVVTLLPYDAVVVGGGVYAGRWQKNARRFLRRHRRELPARPLWLFSSGPLDASASERDIPPVPGVRRAVIRFDAREHITFGGCLEKGAKGFSLASRKAQLWDAFVAQHDKLAREAQEDFNKAFGRDFMAAYQAQLRRLKGGL